jgi:hypothetical protein
LTGCFDKFFKHILINIKTFSKMQFRQNLINFGYFIILHNDFSKPKKMKEENLKKIGEHYDN